MEKQGVKSKNEVSIGDVYVIRLPDKRFGAIRVADYNQVEGSYILITTPYIGEEIPSINDSSLKQILRQNRFFYNNKRALLWVDGTPPKEVINLGNIPLTEKEMNIRCNSFGDTWDNSVGNEAYLEWRWEYDHENFVREVQEDN
ncbi:hypothetical protein [Gracilibacillus sp. Marseille-QA3620]